MAPNWVLRLPGIQRQGQDHEDLKSGAIMAGKADDYTSIGGSRGRFQTTHWTVIQEVHTGDEDHRQQVISDLLKDYWKPVYCYIRRKGYGNDAAKDLTQGFFHEVVLGYELIQRADPCKGRFRTLMLTALDRYLANAHRHQNARKRIPPDHLIPLEHVSEGNLPTVPQDFTCEESFNYAWVSELLDRLLSEVEIDCRHRGMSVHWDLFYERIVRPVLEDRAPPSVAELCAKHGINEAPKASNMIFGVKRRFQSVLKRHIRQSVASDEEIPKEISELANFLMKR